MRQNLIALTLLLAWPPTEVGAQSLTPAVSNPVASVVSDPDLDLIVESERLLREQKYPDAIQLLKQAYAQKPSPRLLFLLGRANQGSGPTRAQYAINYYEQFLAATSSLNTEEQKEAQRSLQQLRSVPSGSRVTATELLADAPQLYAARTKKPPNPNGLLAAGITVLSVGYIPALVFGGLYTGKSGYYRVPGGLLIIPIVGPIISGIYVHATNHGTEPTWAPFAWSLPWILADGSLQITGLILAITGAETKRRAWLRPPISISPYATSAERGLTISGRY